MAGEIAEKQGRSDSGDGVMTWLTGNDPSGGEHDKENDEAGHSFRETVEAIHTEKGGGCGVFYGKPPEHVMRSHEEMSPKKRGLKFRGTRPFHRLVPARTKASRSIL